MATGNFEPINRDLSIMLKWSLNQEEGKTHSLRVTSGNHFYLRPVSQKNTAETCFISKFFNYIIRIFMEGFGCCQTQTTAERIIELTPQSLETEFEVRLKHLKEDFESQSRVILASENKDSEALLGELQNLISKHNGQIEQLSSCAKIIANSLMENRLNSSKNEININQKRQTDLQNCILPSLIKIEKAHLAIKTHIEHPISTLLNTLSQQQVHLTSEQLGSIASDISTVLEACSQNQEIPDSEEALNHEFNYIRQAGFVKECQTVSHLLENEITSALSLLSNFILQTEQKIESFAGNESLEMKDLQVALLLNKLLEDLGLQLTHVGLIPSLSKFMSLLTAERLNHEEYALGNEVTANAEKTLRNTCENTQQYLEAFIIKPLHLFLNGISKGELNADLNLLRAFLNMAHQAVEDLRTGGLGDASSEALELNSYIFSYVLSVAASKEANHEKWAKINALGTADFWLQSPFPDLVSDELNAEEAVARLYNTASELAIVLNAYRLAPAPAVAIEESALEESESESLEETDSSVSSEDRDWSSPSHLTDWWSDTLPVETLEDSQDAEWRKQFASPYDNAINY